MANEKIAGTPFKVDKIFSKIFIFDIYIAYTLRILTPMDIGPFLYIL